MTFAGHLRAIGFKGSGFNYIMDSENFVFTIGIQASQWGGQCCAEFGIQPKDIESIGAHKVDFKKLKYYQCELRTRISRKNGADQWWQYSDNAQKNILIADQIFDIITAQIVPIINRFKENPFVFDQIEVSDLTNIFKYVADKLEGLQLMTTDIRFVWALTKIYEKRNFERARQFARYGLSKLDATSTFIGKADFERVLSTNDA